jgi:hypothetical protein
MAKLALFLSGTFAGGAVDHLILVALSSNMTPYGVRATLPGNLALAALDTLVATSLHYPHRHWMRPK